jgi:iron-sulfur cluster assembly protein
MNNLMSNTSTSISLTPRAADHVRKHLGGETAALRIGVKPTGCSGYKYVVSAVAGQSGDQDRVFETNGVRVVVDSESLRFLAGTQVDYVREGLNEGFRFHNPNVEDTCGCGESFSLMDGK